ncbi:hypothetical protein B484DRAFT_398979 [Ochromonadaceae sp. CCMP2298]|nr:hypothetical protein B484DRAFT_398979 [Ochromonadaceae sp. CCMP2298]
MPVLNASSTRLLREKGCTVHIIGITGKRVRIYLDYAAADIDFFKSCGTDAVFAKMGTLSQPALDAMLASLAPTAGVAVSEPAKKTPAPKTLTPTKLPKPTRRVEKTNLRPIQKDAEEPDHDLDQAVLAEQPKCAGAEKHENTIAVT